MTIQTVGEDLECREIQIVGSHQNGIATLENSSTVSYQAARLLRSTATLKYLLREMRTYVHRKICVPNAKVKLTVEKDWKESKRPAVSG